MNDRTPAPPSAGQYSIKLGERRPRHKKLAPFEKLPRDTLLEGKYAIKQPIGEGGMGVVYEARHVALDVAVAVKVLQPAAEDAALMIERFKAEARSAASIRHSNIVEVTDFGLTPDQRPFFVMELLTGESLAGRLERLDRLSEREAVEIADQVLSALALAHRRGVIHRDLKPENVFLARTDEGAEKVKLLDFGVAKIIGGGVADPAPLAGAGGPPPAESAASRPLTMHGVVLGTPGYIAPETLLIDGSVDNRADLFSVGVLLFEMLTGQIPFRGGTVDEIVDATLYSPVPSPRMLRGEISGAMDRLVLTALAQEPGDRFQSAEEFVRHLTAAAVGRIPEDARPCRTRVVVAVPGTPSSVPPDGRHPDTVVTPEATASAVPSSVPPRAAGASLPPPAGSYSSVPPRSGAYSSAPAPAAPRPLLRPATALLLGAGVLLLAALAISLIVLLPGAESASNATDPGAVTAPPTGKLVTIWIELRPRGATVSWDGVLRSERPLVVPAEKREVPVLLAAPGFVTQRLLVRPDREQTLRVQLVKLPSPTQPPRSDPPARDGGS